MKIKVEFLYDEYGNKTRAILPSNEFENLIEALADLKSIYLAYTRTKSRKRSIPFEKIKEEIANEQSKSKRL